MNTAMESHIDPRRPVDQWLGNYAEDHRHPTNVLIHWICVPLIVWCVIAALWSIPLPSLLIGYFKPGVFAGIAMFLAFVYYLKLSRPLAYGMLVFFVCASLITHGLYGMVGGKALALIAAGVFAAAWIGQFIGHEIEGKRPSFLTDLHYLLIGPIFLLAKLFRKSNIDY